MGFIRSKKPKIQPREYIEQLVQGAADKLFGSSSIPIVVRHTKVLQMGAISHIDYTVPCFELATRLSHSPIKVAESLVQKMRKKHRNSEIQFDAAGGYINFSLNDQWLEQATLDAAEWLDNPTKDNQIKNLKVISFSPVETRTTKPLPQDSLTTTLADLYELIGYNVSHIVLALDASEQAIDTLTAQLSGLSVQEFKKASLQDISLARLRVRVRKAMSMAHKTTENIDPIIDLKEWSYKFKKSVVSKANPRSSQTVMLQTELAPYVHEIISRVKPVKSGDGLIKDAETDAAYYHIDAVEQGIPIRSANGFLYDPAYLLGLLSQTEPEAKATHTIMLAPREYHEFLVDYTMKHNYEIPICIDPQEHLGTIGIIEQLHSTRQLGPAIAAELKRLISTATNLRRAETRLKAISAIDFVHHCRSIDPRLPLVLLRRMLDIVKSLQATPEIALSNSEASRAHHD